MRTIMYLSAVAIVAMCFSCDNNGKQSATTTAADSMEMANKELNDFIDIVASSMDSISLQEGFLFKGEGDKPTTSKMKIRQNLVLYKDILDRQKARIAELDKQLSLNNDARSKKLRVIIASLNKQIAEKDSTIANLQEDLNKKNVDIEKLKVDVESLNDNVNVLTEKNTEQEATIKETTDLMNVAYVRVGTSSELKNAGLLKSGGLFSKKKVDLSKVEASKFTKTDKREFMSIKISGSKPKVLSQMPEGSYRIENNGDGTSTLVVTDAAKFWSVSDFLLIQSK